VLTSAALDDVSDTEEKEERGRERERECVCVRSPFEVDDFTDALRPLVEAGRRSQEDGVFLDTRDRFVRQMCMY